MKYIVKEEVKQATTKCKNKFSCLSGDKNCLYNVENCINGEIIFVKCPKTEHCHYQLPFGYGYICNCPVRKEIYNKYQV